MRKSLCAVVLLLLVLGSGVARAQKSGDNAEFKELIQNYWRAWSSLDPDKAAPMYSKEPGTVYFDVAPLKYNSWDEYKEGVKKVFANAASASFTPNDDLKVTRHGNLAWTSNTFHGVIHQKDGKQMDLDGRHTVIWEKRGGHWIIVHEHVSAPLPG